MGFGLSSCLDGVEIDTLESIPGTTTTNGSVAFVDEGFYIIVA
ncbi:MAG TPA: hypothetical protein VKR27_06440 [Acidimicrobiales bacterium]|nr:hypothetical protein [Acidimicrobiales bacterium]